MRERADDIARSMRQEQGKVLAEAKGEVVTSADIVEWFAEEGRRAYGRIIPSRNPTVRQMVVTEPVGVVAAFTPWNFPVLTPARKIAASLAAGCSIIIKASEETPGRLRRPGEVLRGRGRPARRDQSGVRRAGDGLRAPDRLADRAQDLVHRLGAGRQASRPARRQGHEARHHGARRAFAGRGVRRCRPGKDRRHDLGVQVSQCRPGVHLADALLRAGGDLRPLPQALHRQRQGDQARRRAGEGHHDGAARQCAPPRRDG